MAAVESLRKRKRLAYACNQCRHKKIRCDDRLPECTNCFKAGIQCITTDPRQPGAVVQRREAQSQSYHSPATSLDDTESGTLVSQVDIPPKDNQQYQKEYLGLNTPASAADGPLPAFPRFISGNSLHALTQWLDLAFARIGLSQRFSQYYGKCRPHGKVSFLLQPPTQEIRLDVEDASIYSEAYLSSMNVLFPLFSSTFVRQAIHEVLESREMDSTHSILAILMITTCLINRSASTEHGRDFLRISFSRLSFLVAEGSLRCVQALLLMALALRGHDQIEMAWHILTLAVSLSQSLGIHRRASHGPASTSNAAEEDLRTWWAVYCLDKILAMEMERPSSVRDSECSQELPKPLGEDGSVSFDLYLSFIQLAKVLSQVNERSIRSRSFEETGATEYKEVIREKVQTAGELDEMLLSWANQTPAEFRPSEQAFCDPTLLPCASFLAIQYYQALIILHRNALIINAQVVEKEFEMYCATPAHRLRLRNGHSICCNAARSVIGILNSLHEQKTLSIFQSTNAPLLAAYALAIQVIKHPSSGLAKTDFEMHANAIRLIQIQHNTIGMDNPELKRLLLTLQAHAKQRVDTDAVPASPSSVGAFSRTTNMYKSSQPEIQSRFISSGGSPTYDPGFTPQIREGAAPEEAGQNLDWFDPQNLNMDFGNPADAMSWDWDALALAYDLPSE